MYINSNSFPLEALPRELQLMVADCRIAGLSFAEALAVSGRIVLVYNTHLYVSADTSPVSITGGSARA